MPKATSDKAKIPSDNLFPVVGIGASAGGLDAFKKLLTAIPESSGMAYILVQHLDPSHESILAEILQRSTKVPVEEISDNVKVLPDHIYIIPANKLLTATDGVLKLTARSPKGQKNMPIDLFFSSLAEVHHSHAIGVVLSGTGSDGTLGLKAIKDHGGVTFAQDSDSAAYDAMPRSSVDAGVVDFILSPDKIPEQLQSLNRTFNEKPVHKDEITGQEEDGYRQILSILRIRRGVDFTYYKQTTIRRRIARRIALSMQITLPKYLAYIKENKAEQDILYQDLLIPVTQFFRDPKIFEQLCETVFPTLLKDLRNNDQLRVWIAGCSTGEEAYSIAICLQEYLGDRAHTSRIQVFATDISEIAIAKARNGLYKKSEVGGLTENQLQKYFVKTDGSYRVNKFIRDSCIFAYHNYLKDPPFARMDLISCRNSLIYLEPFLQKKALTTFHYALKDKGYLLLGKSETTGQAADLFTTFDKNNKVYTRKPVRGKFLQEVAERKEEIFRGTDFGFGKKEAVKDDFQKNADDVLLTKFSPPGVVVNEEMDIVQFRGATGMWLEPSSGKPNLNILKMAREGLAFELRNALHKVKTGKDSVIKKDIPIQFMGKELLATIEVIPLLNTIEPHFLILFQDSSENIEPLAGKTEKKGAKTINAQIKRGVIRIEELQKEIAHTREDMRSITEDQEASNEELQSANEELLSGSEELQSLNEELETSREEIQTTNEELIIVNHELFDRNEQLDNSRRYAEAIVSTIREPLLILNKNLLVRSANKSFYSKFKTSEEETEGISLFELGNQQWNIPALRMALEKVLPQKQNINDFEVVHRLPLIGDRIMQLNASQILRDTAEDQCILLAIEDVTEKRNADISLKNFTVELEKQVDERTVLMNEANIGLRNSNDNLEQFAYIASHDLQEPLRKIRTFSIMLHDRFKNELPPDAIELINKIDISSKRMSTLIKELLDFSRILHGDDNYKKVNLNDILNSVIIDFELLIKEKEAVLHFELLPVIEAIPLQINQLFYNLLSNSLKFTSPGVAPVIRITSRILTAEDMREHPSLNPKISYCEIAFRDNGIGFEQDLAEKIFLIFHKLHRREQYAGTGIGLALCKSIVTNHHGEIVGISTKGKGALFQIILPLTQTKG
ncbi:MAG: chemotaxis protein CheB [Flavitalea sp.]